TRPNIVASAADDGTVRLWDIASGKSTQIFTGHTGWVRKVVFSHDGNKLASASSDMTVRLWNVNPESVRVEEAGIEQVLKGHTSGVRSVAFSPAPSYFEILVSSCNDSKVRLWNLTTGEVEKMFESSIGGINSIVVHPNGRQIAMAAGNGSVLLYCIVTGET